MDPRQAARIKLNQVLVQGRRHGIARSGVPIARLLLDTHPVLRWLADDPRLPATPVPLVRDPANTVFVSQASLWEIAIQQGLGRLSVIWSVDRQLAAYGPTVLIV